MSVIIIGAGHAGGSAAIELRKAGFKGKISLIGEEPVPPYQRPPLSKAWLKGEADNDSLALRPVEWYGLNGVDLRLGVRVDGIDPQGRSLTLSDGETLGYEYLIIATGARARQLTIDGAELDGILTLRTSEDAEALKNRIKTGTRVAIVGGGYVGLETAASAVSLGASAVIIEREPRLLARVASVTQSSFFMRLHQGRGVSIEFKAEVSGFSGKDGAVSAVRLADGREIACDVAVVGVGAIPNDELARACGLKCDNGIVVDTASRTSDLHIFAIGDVAFRPHARYGRSVRLESVPNAIEQARQVAAVITDAAIPPNEVPWFWSDQYDTKLQIAGLVFDCDKAVVRGDPAQGRFSVFHLRNGRLQAVEAVNAPGDFMFARTVIARDIPINTAHLANTDVPLKQAMTELNT